MSPLHGEFELACSEGCGLHHNSKVRCCFHLRMHTVLTGTRLYYSMLLQPLSQRSNCCRSRKCIRWHIPVHEIFAVFYLFFLLVIS